MRFLAVWLVCKFVMPHSSLLRAVRRHELLDAREDAELATLRAMQWWTPATDRVPPGDKYVIFSADAGGPNNIRLGLVMTALLTQRLNRTLVLPPPASMYLLDWGPRSKEAGDMPKKTKTLHEDLLDLRQLEGNLATLTWAEFVALNGYQTFEAAAADAQTVTSDHYCDLNAYQALGESRIIYMNGMKREGFSCAEWWLTGQPRTGLKQFLKDDQWLPLFRNGIVWHEDVFKVASKVVNFLGLWQYVAVHARYNDFQFKQNRQDEESLLQRIEPLLLPGQSLYIASDEPSRFMQQRLPGVQIVTFSDLVGSTGGVAAGLLNSTREQYNPERWFKIKGMVDELICTFSKVFVGTERSSFTGHIQQMRIDAGAPVTRTLFHTEHPLPIDLVQRDLELWPAGHPDP